MPFKNWDHVLAMILVLLLVGSGVVVGLPIGPHLGTRSTNPTIGTPSDSIDKTTVSAEDRSSASSGGYPADRTIFEVSFDANESPTVGETMLLNVSFTAQSQVENLTIRVQNQPHYKLGQEQFDIGTVGAGDTRNISVRITPKQNVTSYVDFEFVGQRNGSTFKQSRWVYKIRFPSSQDTTIPVGPRTGGELQSESDSQNNTRKDKNNTASASSNVMVEGTAQYEQPDGTYTAARQVYVAVYDYDVTNADEFLGDTWANLQGSFSVSVDPTDKDVTTDGDVHIAIFAYNPAANVTDGEGNYQIMWSNVVYDLKSDHDFGKIRPNGNNPAFQAADWALDEYRWVRSRTDGWTRSRVNIAYPESNWPAHQYWWDSNGNIIRDRIVLPGLSTFDWNDNPHTIYHEYGHALTMKMYDWYEPNLPDKGSYIGHCYFSETDDGFAVTEGWAEFMAAAVSGNPDAVQSREAFFSDLPESMNIETNYWYDVTTDKDPDNDGNQECAAADTGDMDGNSVEGSYASILFDIVDSGNANDESMDKLFSTVFNTIRFNHPGSTNEFWNAWFSEGYGASVPKTLTSIFHNYGIRKAPTLYAISNEGSVLDSKTDDYTFSVSAQENDGWKFDIKYAYTDGSVPNSADHSALPTSSTTVTTQTTLTHNIPRSEWTNHIGDTLYWKFRVRSKDHDATLSGWSQWIQAGTISDDDTSQPQFSNIQDPGDIKDSYSSDYRLQLDASDSSGIAFVEFRYKFGSSGSWSSWQSPTGNSGSTYWFDIPRSKWTNQVGKTVYWEVRATDGDTDRSNDQKTLEAFYTGGSISDDDTDEPSITDVTVSENNGDGDGTIEDDEEIRVEWRTSDVSGIRETFLFEDGANEPEPLFDDDGDDFYYALDGPKAPGEYDYAVHSEDADTDRSGDTLINHRIFTVAVDDDDATVPSVTNPRDDGDVTDADSGGYQIMGSVGDTSGVESVRFRYKFGSGSWSNWKAPSGSTTDSSGNGDYWYNIPESQWKQHVGKNIHWQVKTTDNDQDHSGDKASGTSTTFTAGKIKDDDSSPPTFGNTDDSGDSTPGQYIFKIEIIDPGSGVKDNSTHPTIYFNYGSGSFDKTSADGSVNADHVTGEWYNATITVPKKRVGQTLYWRAWSTDTDNDRQGDTAGTLSSVFTGGLIQDLTAPQALVTANNTTPQVNRTTVQFDASASSDNIQIAYYKWDFDGDGIIDANLSATSGGATTTHVYEQPGTFAASVTVVDTIGNKNTTTVSITAVDTIAPDATLTGPDTAFTNNSVTFDASGSSDNHRIDTYHWDFEGDGTNETTTNSPTVTHTYTKPGKTYTVTVYAVDRTGNVGTATKTVETKLAPAVNITSPAEGMLLETSDVTVNYTTQNMDVAIAGGVEYSVDNSAWSGASGGLVTLSGLSDGTHVVDFRIVNATGHPLSFRTAHDTVNFTVDTNSPTAAVAVNTTTVTVTEIPVKFDASGSKDKVDIVEYRWDFDEDDQIEKNTTSPTLSHVYDVRGTYNASVTVVDAAGHTASIETDTIHVTAPPVPLKVSPKNATAIPTQTVTVNVTLTSTYVGVNETNVTLRFNESALNVTVVESGGFLSTDGTTPDVTTSIDNETGQVVFNATQVSGVTGQGALFTVTFRVDENISRPLPTDLTLSQAAVTGADGLPLRTDIANGTAYIPPNVAPRLSVTLVDNVTNVGSPTHLSIEAKDLDGTLGDVTLYLPNGTNVTISPTEAVNREVTVTFQNSSWNSTRGEYEPVTIRVQTVDNNNATTSTAVMSKVYIAGDVNGDGAVNIFDSVLVGRAWDTKRGEPSYTEAADLTNDGTVDIIDAVSIGQNWNDNVADAEA